MKSVLIVCLFLLASSHGQLSRLGGFLGKIGQVSDQGFDLMKDTVLLGTGLTDSGIQKGTDLGKLSIVAGQDISKQALGGGVQLGKDTLEFVDSLSGIVPGLSWPVNKLTSFGKEGLDVVQLVGDKGITAGSQLGQIGFDAGQKVSKLSTGTVDTVAETGTGLAKDTIKATLGVIGDTFGTVMDVGGAYVPGTIDPVTTTTTPAPIPETTAKSSWFGR